MMISRRHCLGIVGAGLVLVPTASDAAFLLPSNDVAKGAEDKPLCASELLAPLEVGSMIGTWRIEKFGSLHAGALGVVLSDAQGQRFQVDICARDKDIGAPSAPAHTERCDLFIANGGKGNDPTSETQGLAAMTLAEVIKSHEHRTDLKGLLTLRRRLAHHGNQVVRRLDD